MRWGINETGSVVSTRRRESLLVTGGDEEVLVAVERDRGAVCLGLQPEQAREVVAALLTVADELEGRRTH